ncbi:AAA family ATPase [Verrucomicrobium sp. BvORR034]|uniref:AAA family ATPase n=1 Tax=Verrucomicrobium sp. BvORR034 TaxID=1396418 RepID=UPI000679D2D5|nr:AAA family ATPase [Verrucomicrobium sp. BvORR034]
MTLLPGLIQKPAPAAQANGEKQDTPFEWSLVSANDRWTDDPDRIANMSDPPIIDGMLREREVATVVGPAKTAKTWFTLKMALAVAGGDPFLGRATFQRKVLYLDYELKPGTFEKRMCMTSEWRPEGFHYQCLRGRAKLPGIADITTLVEAEGFGLVVVDSLYRTGWLQEENNNDTTSRDLTALQSFTAKTNCSLICVDHTAKGGGTDKSAVDAARGASAKGGFYDSLFVLRPTDKGPDIEKTYAVLDPVLRDWPRFSDLPLVEFAWHQGRISIDVAGEVQRGDAHGNAARVLAVIASSDEPIRFAEIQDGSGLSEGAARRILKNLVVSGRVVESPDPGHKQGKVYSIRESEA